MCVVYKSKFNLFMKKKITIFFTAQVLHDFHLIFVSLVVTQVMFIHIFFLLASLLDLTYTTNLDILKNTSHSVLDSFFI